MKDKNPIHSVECEIKSTKRGFQFQIGDLGRSH